MPGIHAKLSLHCSVHHVCYSRNIYTAWSPFAYQAVHLHRFRLTEPMTPVFCLTVYLRVEVNIMQNNCVSTCQVQALSTSSG